MAHDALEELFEETVLDDLDTIVLDLPTGTGDTTPSRKGGPRRSPARRSTSSATVIRPRSGTYSVGRRRRRVRRGETSDPRDVAVADDPLLSDRDRMHEMQTASPRLTKSFHSSVRERYRAGGRLYDTDDGRPLSRVEGGLEAVACQSRTLGLGFLSPSPVNVSWSDLLGPYGPSEVEQPVGRGTRD